MPPQVYRCHMALRGWRARSNQQCGERSDGRERSRGVLLGCQGFLSVGNAGPMSWEEPPSWAQQDSLCPWSAFLCGPVSLLRRAGGQRTALQLEGMFVYLRLYCVHILWAFRAQHQYPTPRARRRTSIQTSQDFLADGGSARGPYSGRWDQNPSEQAVSPPTPSPPSPHPGRLEAQQQRLDMFGRSGREEIWPQACWRLWVSDS